LPFERPAASTSIGLRFIAAKPLVQREMGNVSSIKANDRDSGNDSGSVDSFLPLLIAICLLFVLVPISKQMPLVFTMLASLVLLSGMLAVLRDPSFRVWVALALAICLPLRWAAHFWGDRASALIMLSHLAVSVFFALLEYFVITRVMAHPRITRQTLIGAICGYLLIGITFTFWYAALTFLDPAAIAVSGQSIGEERAGQMALHVSELSYFSFITLSTVGYGDIVPVSPFARSMAIFEALSGQLYLAAFVARLVGMMSSPSYEQH
jgi:hypothetical protein